jgi:hypothetical protein
MKSARGILARVVRGGLDAGEAHIPRHFSRFSDPDSDLDDGAAPVSPSAGKLSRFSHQHTRTKPAARAGLDHEQIEAIVSQVSNDGTDMIPLSVLKAALPDRIAPTGGLDALPDLMKQRNAQRQRRA